MTKPGEKSCFFEPSYDMYRLLLGLVILVMNRDSQEEYFNIGLMSGRQCYVKCTAVCST